MAPLSISGYSLGVTQVLTGMDLETLIYAKYDASSTLNITKLSLVVSPQLNRYLATLHPQVIALNKPACLVG